MRKERIHGNAKTLGLSRWKLPSVEGGKWVPFHVVLFVFQVLATVPVPSGHSVNSC